jgi:hypothetical protein
MPSATLYSIITIASQVACVYTWHPGEDSIGLFLLIGFLTIFANHASDRVVR